MRGFRLARQDGDPARLAAYQASYEASVKEVFETATAEGPFDKAGLDARFGEGCWRASPRQAVWQGDPAHISDLAYGKWRPVDDATRSKINASFRPIEKVSFPRPDFLATMARLLYAAAERDGWADTFDVSAGTDDEPQAFRNSPCSQPQYTVVYVINPVSGRVEACVPRGHNFGLRASPPNYCPKPELITAVARRLFGVVCDHALYGWLCVCRALVGSGHD